MVRSGSIYSKYWFWCLRSNLVEDLLSLLHTYNLYVLSLISLSLSLFIHRLILLYILILMLLILSHSFSFSFRLECLQRNQIHRLIWFPYGMIFQFLFQCSDCFIISIASKPILKIKLSYFLKIILSVLLSVFHSISLTLLFLSVLLVYTQRIVEWFKIWPY